jgi:DNA end-binding protein Ku
MRSIWKGSIGFGLVNIPVKLYSATQESNLDLDMVDRRDGAKIHFQRISENTGRVVNWENIAKAYKLNEEYVLLNEADFEEAAPEKSKIIQVNYFVNEEEIDTIYFENSYYTEPEKSGTKAYALLREALKKSGKVGVTQFIMRAKEALAVLKPMGNVLLLSKMRFAQEIRNPKDLLLPVREGIKPAELKMALALINQYSTPFDIQNFKDEYSSALLKIIKAKASGKRPSTYKLKIGHTRTGDLMKQLKDSLNKKQVA